MGFIFLHVPGRAEPSTAMGLWETFPTGIRGHPTAPTLWPSDILNPIVFGFPTPPHPVPRSGAAQHLQHPRIRG